MPCVAHPIGGVTDVSYLYRRAAATTVRWGFSQGLAHPTSVPATADEEEVPAADLHA